MSSHLQVNPGDIPAERLQKGSLITAVANHKEMLIGQKLRLEGQWIRHKKYGSQLEVCLSRYHHSKAVLLAIQALPLIMPSCRAFKAWILLSDFLMERLMHFKMLHRQEYSELLNNLVAELSCNL